MPNLDPPSLYDTPFLYEALFDPGLADLDFYAAWAKDCGGTVLELGCGTGRLLWPLRKTGQAVEGLDQSAAMLAACREAGSTQGLQAPLHQGDWRSFNLEKRFAGLFLPFNGLQHLHSAEDLASFFERVRAHLHPGGQLALDLHLPQPALLARDPREHFGVEDGPRTMGDEQVVAEQSAYDAPSQVQTQTWTLAHSSGASRQVSLSLRQFFPQELKALLKAQGFGILSHAGGFQGQTLGPGSLKQVLLCRLL